LASSSYKSRVIDAELQTLLSATGAVIIEGPRASGKTSSARQVAASEVLLDIDDNAKAAAAVDPSLVLAGDSPRLIDEWQIEPKIWNHVRREVDKRKLTGQFILTGSSVPADDVTRHTGAGRISRLTMRPMTLYETGHSTGDISLEALLAGDQQKSVDSGITVPLLAERITIGGWPALLDLEVNQAIPALRGYVNEIARSDISRVDQIRRDPHKVRNLLKSLARNTASTPTITTLALDSSGSKKVIDEDTVRTYLDNLHRLFVIEDLPGWDPNIRSRARIRSTPKRHFVDPSLAAATLRLTPERMLSDLKMMGFLFESLAVRDLRVYAQAHDATVHYYRDNTGLEVDAVVEDSSGNWAAFEIKLGHGYIDEAASHLKRFAARIDSNSSRSLSIIVGTGLGYTRDDGINIVPIGSLGP